MQANISIHPGTASFESGAKVPTPQKLTVAVISSPPAPISKIWAFTVAQISPPVGMVNCMKSDCKFSSGKPFGASFSANQAAPVASSINKSVPDKLLVASKCAASGVKPSTKEMADSSPDACSSIPIVNQLSAVMEGANAIRKGLIAVAIVPPKLSL